MISMTKSEVTSQKDNVRKIKRCSVHEAEPFSVPLNSWEKWFNTACTATPWKAFLAELIITSVSIHADVLYRGLVAFITKQPTQSA
jgi:hypothetical protein